MVKAKRFSQGFVKMFPPVYFVCGVPSKAGRAGLGVPSLHRQETAADICCFDVWRYEKCHDRIT